MTFRVKSKIKELFREQEANKTYVCKGCLGDSILKRLGSTLTTEQACFACQYVGSDVLEPVRIARFIQDFLPKHFEVDKVMLYRQEITLAGMVNAAIRCADPRIAQLVAEQLENPKAPEDHFYAPGHLYRPIPSPFDSEEHERWYYVGNWRLIEAELKHGRRYDNARAKEFFERLINEALGARSGEHPDVPAVVRMVPTNESFFRARIAKEPGDVDRYLADPAKELGAPPQQHAGNNRMSAAGVPLLYVSSDTYTCIAEVRPECDDTVVVGRFESKVPLKLFDFTALSGPLGFDQLSLFEIRFEERRGHRALLSYLHDLISQPVETPDTDYVVTQALTEFICFHPEADFDGIVFRSVQRPEGINYVLFDKGPEQGRWASDWRPSFKVEIAAGDTTVHCAGVTVSENC